MPSVAHALHHTTMGRGYRVRLPVAGWDWPRVAGSIAGVSLIATIFCAFLIARTPHGGGDPSEAAVPGITGTPAAAVFAGSADDMGGQIAVASPEPATTPGGPAETNGEPVVGMPPGEPMARAIDGLVAGQEGVYGVVVMRPSGEILYARNGATPFVAASLYKLIVMAVIEAKIERGELARDRMVPISIDYFEFSEFEADSYYDPTQVGMEIPVDEALYATGAFSSNVAAHALLSLTTHRELDAMITTRGLTGTRLFATVEEAPRRRGGSKRDGTDADAAIAEAFVEQFAGGDVVNLTTPYDMARFFSLLMQGKIVNQTVSDAILDILKQQVVNDRFPRLLPPETPLAHKTGNLDGVVHDVGVIYRPDGPIILAAMVEAQPDRETATLVVQRLALIAYGDYAAPPDEAVEREPA